MASRRPGSRAFLRKVSFFWMCGPTRSNNSRDNLGSSCSLAHLFGSTPRVFAHIDQKEDDEEARVSPRQSSWQPCVAYVGAGGVAPLQFLGTGFSELEQPKYGCR